MSIYGKKKRISPSQSFDLFKTSNVFPLSTDELSINFNGEKASFNRLLYVGVPSQKDVKANVQLQSVDREPFIRQIYTAFTSLPTDKKSGAAYFRELCRFIRFIDEQHPPITSEKQLKDQFLKDYNAYLNNLHKTEEISRKTASQRKTNLKLAIQTVNFSNLSLRHLTKVKKARSTATQGLASKEFATLLKELIRLYRIYVNHYLTKTKPDICPCYHDLTLSDKDMIYAKRSMKVIQIENQVNALALLIYNCYTGSNLTPALNLEYSNIEFRKAEKGGYELISKKARHKDQEQGQSIGFTKIGYEFFSGWLSLSEILNSGSTKLFSFRDKNGHFSDNTNYHKTPHKHFYKILEKRGFTGLTTRKNRASRQTLVQRAFKDIQITARAANNDIRTIARHYSDGDKNTSDLKITAGFRVMVDTAKGEDKKESIEKNIQIIEDVFTTEEWKQKRTAITSLDTPSGVKCTTPFAEKAKRSLRAYRNLNASENAPCIDYLECFGCPSHALVAEVELIWLMLSFKDSILESMTRPSMNSYPSEKCDNLLVQVNNALQCLKEADNKAYNEAIQLNNSGSHPAHESIFNHKDFSR